MFEMTVSILKQDLFAVIQAHFLLMSVLTFFLLCMVFIIRLRLNTVLLGFVRWLIIDQNTTSVHSRIKLVPRIAGPSCIPLPHEIRCCQRALSGGSSVLTSNNHLVPEDRLPNYVID
jgi:hypothetical protein